MEKIKKENLIEETKDSPEGNRKSGFEMSQSQAQQIAHELSFVGDRINHDKAVSEGDIEKVDTSVKQLKIDVGGEEMTMEEAEKIPDLKENSIIWTEIRKGNLKNIDRLTHTTPAIDKLITESILRDIEAGNFEHHSRLTSISNDTARHLAAYKGFLNLHRITTLPDRAAEYLSEHKGSLSLNKVRSLSDHEIEYLSRHKGPLTLGVTELSEVAASYLSEHTGDLYLNDVTFISDSVAEELSKHKGKVNLCGLQTLSEVGADHLSKLQGNLGLGIMTDDIAKRLTKFSYWLSIWSVSTISDTTAKYLSQRTGGIDVNNFVLNKIAKYKK